MYNNNKPLGLNDKNFKKIQAILLYTKKYVTQILVTATLCSIALFSCDNDKPEENGGEKPPVVETVKFSIGSISQLKSELPKITAAAADQNKFVEIDLTNNIGVNADDLDVLRTFGEITFDEKRYKINTNGKFVYPLQAGIKLSFVEWQKWQSLPLGANPNNGYKFVIPKEDASKFPTIYANVLELEKDEPPIVVLDTISFTIANAAELKSKIVAIKSAADDEEKFADITFTGNVLITDEFREMLASIGAAIAADKAKATWTGFVAPASSDMKLTFAEWESWGNPPLGKNGNNSFLVAPHEKNMFGDYSGMLEIDPDAVELEVVNFTIANATELKSKIAQIKATEVDEKKFGDVLITGNIQIADEHRAMLQDLASFDPNRVKVTWNAGFVIAPSVAGMKLTFAEWESWGKRPLGKNGNIAFLVPENEIALFVGYSNMLEIDPDTVVIETVNFTIANATELKSKLGDIKATAADAKKIAKISITGNILIAEEHRVMLKDLATIDAEITWHTNFVIAPSVANMKLTFAEWESWGKRPLGKNGNIAFLVPENERALFVGYANMLDIDPDTIAIETVTFNIANSAQLANQINNITTAKNDPKKFAQVNITSNIGILEADKANWKTLRTLKYSSISGSNLKNSTDNGISVNWGSFGIYAAAKGVKLNSTEWAEMNSSDEPQLKIVASPTGDKF